MNTLTPSFYVLIIIALLQQACHSYKERYPMPYIDPIETTARYVDSLKATGIDTLIVYERKGFMREHIIFLKKQNKIHLLKITNYAIMQLDPRRKTGNSLPIFDFYLQNYQSIITDSIYPADFYHYPYTNIEIIVSGEQQKFHLPYGTESIANSMVYHFARVIESTLYTLEKDNYWLPGTKGYRYFPRRYKPGSEKWQAWEREQIKK